MCLCRIVRKCIFVVFLFVLSLLRPICGQGLKYNFQGGGTVQLSGPAVRSRAPRSFPGPTFQ